MIKVNCAAFSRELVESELFGHERGAFTGAINAREGKFEIADGGTLFLDEIGDMPLETQAKILRVLQERELERVGGNRTIKVDVRVLAATNQDLESKVQNGSFREDLFYRLNVVPIALPPLRERREDLPLLDRALPGGGGGAPGAAGQVAGARRVSRRLLAYDWPGNVRELEHALEQALVLASGDAIQLDDLPAALRGGTPRADASSAAPPSAADRWPASMPRRHSRRASSGSSSSSSAASSTTRSRATTATSRRPPRRWACTASTCSSSWPSTASTRPATEGSAAGVPALPPNPARGYRSTVDSSESRVLPGL